MSAQESSSNTMDIRIHPLVVMNIADHFTRAEAQYGAKRVIGALFGEQHGREVQVYDSFDIATQERKEKDEILKVETEAFENDMKLYSECYPKREFLGWYATGEHIKEGDSEIHSTMIQYNERPLFLLLDTNSSDDRELPVFMYEEEMKIVDDRTTKEFVQTPFSIQSDEAERITAVHCANVVVEEIEGPTVEPHVKTLKKSISALHSRVAILDAFLADVESGKVSADNELLRDIKGICNRLPTVDSEPFRKDFVSEYNDAVLVNFLASITKSADTMNSLISKFGAAMEGNTKRAGPSRGMWG